MMLSRRLQQAAQRLADQQSDRLRNAPSQGVFADVIAVAAGAANDGNALVTVTFQGSDVIVGGYDAAYTPVVGHRVVCIVVDRQLIILGRVVGYST